MSVADQASDLRERAEEGKPGPVIPAGLRCLAIGSGKGGVGKTMVAIGTATCLARLKYRVLVLDADLGLANVDLQMGIDPAFTLQDVVYGSCTLEEAVVSAEDGLDVLAAASGSPELVDMGSARRQMLVNDLIRFAGRYDFLIIDVGAGIGKGVTAFLAAAPEVLVVVANEPTSIMDAYALIKVLRQEPDPPSIMMVVNMVRTLEEGELLAQRLNTITKKFLGVEIPVAGVVTYDAVVGDAIRARTPLVRYAEKSAPARCISDLARFITGGGGFQRPTGRVDKPFFDKLAGVGWQAPKAAES